MTSGLMRTLCAIALLACALPALAAAVGEVSFLKGSATRQAAGGTSVHEPQDEEYGDRSAGVRGPCGNVWWLAQPTVTPSP